ncbi:DUF4238 domain-containing protein [Methylobacterium aquaticum]|uniref:DUF4238 domain-containing protein n=1 Tax=Methylobacterium aquaticum TaxID=270351 RepID=A0A0C6FKZ9_9HYPH|nr:DUF4238 domain-containing protein [Methylobacterium aquaticum]BAQ45829.1 hypothetical protein Maq22A_c12980 [Methylobacterium aquaticum]
MAIAPKPKFEKKDHHVVPKLWQKRFKAVGDVGPYYLNIITGEKLGPVGPGVKMSEVYVNIVFDEYFRPSDELEDSIAKIEDKAVEGLDYLIANGEIDDKSRCDIAMLLALQACRYPERFADRMELGKYLAIALKDFKNLSNVSELNSAIAQTGMLPGASFTEAEFARLKGADEASVSHELDDILALHGYEAHYNPGLIISATTTVASHLLALEWKLVHSPTPAFILSDRPVPMQVGYGFFVGLTASYGLKITKPVETVATGKICSQEASEPEIDEINAQVRGRAQTLICGPGAWVHEL